MSWVTGKIDTIQPTKGNPASLLPPVYRPSAIGLQAFANYLTQPCDPLPIAADPITPDRVFPDAIVYTDQYPPADPVAPTAPDHPDAPPAINAPSPSDDHNDHPSPPPTTSATSLPLLLSPAGTSLSEPDNSLSGGAAHDNHATNADPVYAAQYPPADPVAPTAPDHPVALPAINAPSPSDDHNDHPSPPPTTSATSLPLLLSPEGTSLSEPDNSLSGGAAHDHHATNADSPAAPDQPIQPTDYPNLALGTQHLALSFGARLRTARQRAGIATLRQFSELLFTVGIHRSAASLGNWERDRHRPPNRAQLLPILSFIAQRNGLHTLTDINNLLWLLDWRDLNSAETERYFPLLSHSSSIAAMDSTQPIATADPDITTTLPESTSNPQNDPVPTSQRDHFRDHSPFPITRPTPHPSTISSGDQPSLIKHHERQPMDLPLLSTQHLALSTSSAAPSVSR